MIGASMAHDRAVKAIKKEVYDKIKNEVEIASDKGCLDTHVYLDENDCSDALIAELKDTYNYSVDIHYLDTISESGSFKIDLHLKW